MPALELLPGHVATQAWQASQGALECLSSGADAIRMGKLRTGKSHQVRVGNLVTQAFWVVELLQ